jgi:hypothetical protein
MTSNPFYNALFAIAYIIVLVSLAFSVPRLFGFAQQSIFYPMIALAVLVLSVAVMAYLFFYQPITLLLDGQRQMAVTFFLKTVGAFAVGTVAILLVTVVVNGVY